MHPRHLEIRYHQLEALLRQQVQGFLSVARSNDTIVLLPEHASQRLEHIGLVIHQQDLIAFRWLGCRPGGFVRLLPRE